MTTPTPTLSPLTAGDGFLIADWLNNPYLDINNAYLLVVNTSNYSDIQYIYLTETQALEQTFKISGLVNSVTYLVQYTQTQLTPDGLQGSSNTESGTPLATPAPPVILDNDQYPVVVDYDTVNATYTITLWVDYGAVAYSPALEKTIFKSVAETAASISSTTFTITSGPAQYVQYSFSGLTADTYAMSCLNVNNNGVGPLSNVVSVAVGADPFICDVTQVVSGEDSQLTVSVNTPQNLAFPISSIELYYSTDDINWDLGTTIPSSAFSINLGVITATGVITGLVNGTGYYVKSVAVNSEGSGASGTEGTGIPAIQSTVNIVVITSASSGNVEAFWTYTQNTFQTALEYNYILTQNGSQINSGTTTSTTLSLTGLSLVAGATLLLNVTPVDTVPGSMWTYPALATGNKWVGTAVNSAPFIVNDAPNAPTNFACVGAENQVLSYSWTASAGSGYNDATGYTIRLLDSGFNIVSGPTTVDAATLNFTFYGLTNNTDYTAILYATNAYGNSSSVQAGPNQAVDVMYEANGFVGPVQGVPLPSGLYPLTTTWDAFSQTGYTLIDYTVYVYQVVSGSGVIVETATTTLPTYTFNSAAFGNSYYFGVVINAYLTQFPPFNVQISSNQAYGSTWVVAALPFINPANVVFGVDGNGNGTLQFTVDNRGSDLLGLISFIPPSSGSPNPIQAPPNNYYPFQNGPGDNTYTANLGYPITIPNTPYLIYAVNQVGGAFIQAYLD